MNTDKICQPVSEKRRELPILPLQNTVAYPFAVLPLAVGVPRSVRLVDEAFAGERFEAAFLLAVTMFSLLLAGVGLYGIVAHEVLERRAEMGLRMALGAQPPQAIWAAASGGLRLTILGVFVGGVLSFGLSGVIESLLFGVTARDPVTAVGLFVAMLIFGLAATLVPAARIGRLDPALALRGS